jgi:chromosome segregation ATPase
MLERQLQQLSEQLGNEKERGTVLERELAQARHGRTDAMRTCEALERTQVELGGQLEAERRQHAATSARLQSELCLLQQELTQATNARADVERNFASLECTCHDIGKLLEDEQHRNSVLHEDLNRACGAQLVAEGRAEMLDKKQQECSHVLQGVQHELMEARRQLGAEKLRHNAASSQCFQLQQQLEHAEQEASRAFEDRAAAEKRADNAESSACDLRKQLDDERRRLYALQEQHLDAQQQHTATRAQNAALAKELEQVSADRESARQEIIDAETKIGSMQAELCEVNDQLGTERKFCADLVKENLQNREHIISLQSSLDKLHQMQANLSEALDVASTSLASTQAKLSETQQKLSESASRGAKMELELIPVRLFRFVVPSAFGLPALRLAASTGCERHI